MYFVYIIFTYMNKILIITDYLYLVNIIKLLFLFKLLFFLNFLYISF